MIISGAGSGIGQAIVQGLAQVSENKLILIGRRVQKLEQTRASLNRSQQHEIVPADLREPHAMRSAFAELGLKDQNVVGVIANAGVGGENHYGENDRWDEIIATNLTGTYNLIQEALPLLRASTQEYRHIIIVSSILARIGVPKYSAYCASKAGLLGLMRSLAAELAQEKILVNAICPGWVQTDMADQGIQAMAQATGKSFEAVYKEQMSYVPLGKMSQPQEIAQLVSYLAGPSQQSITGQAFDINNGAWMSV